LTTIRRDNLRPLLARPARAERTRAHALAQTRARSPPTLTRPARIPSSRQPFPDFHTRQAAMLEKKGMSFEERLAVMQGGGE
jgi:hypothetical protein